MAQHIGKHIEKILKQRGMTKTSFSDRINKSRENVYSICKRKTIDTGLLLEISKVLDYDFFQEYSTTCKVLKKENEMLREMVDLLKSKKKK